MPRLSTLIVLSALVLISSHTTQPGSAEVVHEVIFAVHQNGVDRIETILNDVSNPTSANYGKYLTFEEVGAIVANPTATQAVLAWLKGESVRASATVHGEYVRASANCSVWNRVLAADFHTTDDKVSYSKYEVPTHVHPHVSHVKIPNTRDDLSHRVPVVSRSRDHGSVSAAAAPTPPKPYATPALLNKVYNITSNSCNKLGSQSVYETNGENFSPEDLAAWQKEFFIPNTPIAWDIGGNNDSSWCNGMPGFCNEGNLDTQFITAVAQDLPTWYWSVNKETFAYWLVDVANNKDAPFVHSISYSEAETAGAEINAFNTEAMKLGVMGKTLVVSSGDDGVAGVVARSSAGLCAYNPVFPASSPYVTAVGATMGPENNTAEVTCSSALLPADGGAFITSGGGFSAAMPTPGFQADAVKAYLAQNASLGPGYNAKGRGYPDVSMLGHSYPITVGGGGYLKDGTSASTPVFAAVLSIVNSRRLALKKATVGWANPALYRLAEVPGVFNDITQGANNCCAGGWDGPAVCCSSNGFKATRGWDPATGLGSVNVGNLIDAWVKM